MANENNFDVIFTTAYDQYAIKAIRFSALDYLLKPIDVLELQNAVNRHIINSKARINSYWFLIYSPTCSKKTLRI